MATSEQTSSISVGLSIEKYAWNRSAAKRIFDLIFALAILMILWPVMLIAALLVKFGSKGPVFFQQTRMGQDGKSFRLFKFRTMEHARHDPGSGLTRQGDARVFPVGRFLRRWKLDELPQFFNVLQGDMSLVGPRPDLPVYISSLKGAQRQILLLKPGITGAATLQFSDEEKVLATVPPEQLESFYISQVLPEKVRLDLQYASRASLASDLKVLLQTAQAIVL